MVVFASIFKDYATDTAKLREMSFFGDLTSGGIRMPEAVFDQSSMLPPLNTAGYGGGFDGTPDARINQGSSLFSDMEPYAYGKGARLSTQTAYLANPHNIQKIVPQLILPECTQSTGNNTFILPHSVSDGDVAFSIRFSSSEVRTALMANTQDFFRQGAGRAVDYVCNVATINYIMRGMFTEQKYLNKAWRHYATALGWEEEYDAVQKILDSLAATDDAMNPSPSDQKAIKKLRMHLRSRAEHLVRDHFRPIGVVIGSDKQGGQHEVGQKTVTWPVAYVVTISIDGRNENLCNYWRHMDVSSGSDLGFFVEMRTENSYALNYSKQVTHKDFAIADKRFRQEYPQLCPNTIDNVKHEDRKLSGHWHICMSQAMHQKLTSKSMCNDVTTVHVGALVLSTISIVWVRKWKPDTAIIKHGVTKSEEGLLRQLISYGPVGSVWSVGGSEHPVHTDSRQPLYMTQNQTARTSQGKIAITLSTHDEKKQRVNMTPRPLTEEELAAMGMRPRATVKRALPNLSIQAGEPPLSKAKIVDPVSMAPGDSYVSSSKIKTSAQVQESTTKPPSSSSRKKEASGRVL